LQLASRIPPVHQRQARTINDALHQPTYRIHMKLSQKAVRLFSKRGYRSTLHALHRWSHPISLSRVKAQIDLAGLNRIRSRHGVEGEATRYPKYLDVDRFLRMNIRRAQDLRLNITPPLRVLDLGSGAGYFLHVCRYLGHTGMGLDMAEPPMFGEMFELLGLQRVVWRIEAFTPLPAIEGRFDLITAFSICFNGHKSDRVWGVPEWKFLLDNLRNDLLAPGGKIYFDLNPEADGSSITPALRTFFEQQGGSIDRSKVRI
jgi:SAM-dependent methyltransferase